MALTRTRAATRRRRWTAVLGATALVAAAGGALAAPATALGSAQSVDFATRCVPPPIAGIPPIEGTTTAVVSVDNTHPKVGDTVKVTYSVTKPAASNPVDLALPADILTPTGKVVLGGAQTGTVSVTGPKKNPPVPGKGSFPGFSMTGSFTVSQAGAITLAPGDYNIHTSYLMELDTPCTVLNPPAPVSETVQAGDDQPQPNARTLELGAASGAPGARVTVTGGKFTPLAEVTVVGRAGGAETADRMTLTTDSEGGFTARLKVNDKATTGIVAYEGATWDAEKGAGPLPYQVIDDTPAPPGSQRLTASVTAGELSMSQAGDAVQLSAVDFGTGGAATGALQTVTVKDFRGGPAGWSLTGKVTDFAGPGGAIGADRLSWTPACVAKEGSPSACAAGTAGPVGTGATLASTANGTVTGGEFTVDAQLALDVPAFTAPGSYAGVLTLTLS
ncbi:beta-xylosidase [Streptomyces termitum]|uniref:beta-xylosidase n=1 Tax=Streptomyces termitum TaxID=67368 RepID=UPI0033AAF8EC